jgi:hypothetical protein
MLPSEFPEPLSKFLAHLTENGTFVPDNLLTHFEMNRVELDNYGAFVNMEYNRENMIVIYFLFTKILIARILL